MRYHEQRSPAPWLFGMVLVACATMAIAPDRAEPDQRLLLEVMVNGSSTNKIGEFTLHDGALFARREELNDIGLQVPDDIRSTQDGLVAIAALPGVAAQYDQAGQVLNVTA